jgi:hypothetical protein
MSIELIIAKLIEPSNTLQNPYRKLKPGTITAANPNVIAFTINKNNPKVGIIKGKVKNVKVKNVRIGSKIAFNIPKTAAEIAALPKPSTSIPKKDNLEIIKKLTAVTNQVMMIPTIVISYRTNNSGNMVKLDPASKS